MRMTDLQAGWLVVGNDGGRVGTVKDVTQNYIVTADPVSSNDLFIPASAVANILDGVIQLNIAQRDVRHMGWHQGPRDDDALQVEPEGDLHRHI